MSNPSHPAYEVRRQVNRIAAAVLCDNPGPLEGDGTNTWVLRAPGSPRWVVVDPGPPDNPAHTEAVVAACGGPEQIEAILVTHRHYDHTGGLDDLVAATGAPARAWSAQWCRDAKPFRDREIFEVAGLRMVVLHTPGHTADSVSLLADPAGERAVLAGDTVLGRGTPLLDPEDGSLRDYLTSLRLLAQVGRGCSVLPGHGPDLPDLVPVVHYYLEHRAHRLDAIRGALDTLGAAPQDVEPEAVVAQVYADLDPSLWPAALLTVRTHLEFLCQTGV
ncbi:MAG: MBL fold metallo-hydrolase [Cellulomonas sp.]|nr:MBL fold metallo-hydrolase [Cellulomonas sp.]